MLKPPHAHPVPHLITPLPGPRAREVIEADGRVTSPSYTRVYPLVAARGRGAMLEDVDGNRFLDFTAGIAVCSTGHCHPRVVRAITEQAGELLHMSGTDFYYQPQRQLAEKLAAIAPGPHAKRVFFTNSGTEAVEAAFKLARYHTRRSQVIAFLGSFHGRTMGALSLTGSKPIQRRGFGPLVPQVTHVEYPNCYRCPRSQPGSACCLGTLEQLERLFAHTVPADEVAAVFVEPIQGEGGYIVPPAEFLPGLQRLCERHGILLIADEVQTGMGRTGRMFACQHWGVEPDIICLAKGIASGMPLGAIVARDEIMTWPPGAHASTFGGNPVSCVAALETIALLEEGLVENAARVGDYLLGRLRELAPRHPQVGDVRGRGLMLAVELVEDRVSRRPDPRAAAQVMQRCFELGLLVLTCGKSCIRLCPPLVIGEREADVAVELLDRALADSRLSLRESSG
ncbi:MAG: acetyl ornithine aminotransferase family protein [Pirellulaceae bacterium]|nr:acetyl ornithine aminotransferase family protein [Pirellulaceae bacterium]